MLKGMDPASLASLMGQSGIHVTPEQAATMVNKLDGVSGGWMSGCTVVVVVVAVLLGSSVLCCAPQVAFATHRHWISPLEHRTLTSAIAVCLPCCR